MALTEFVRNVKDISDDGGYKFRFHCDRCNDGVESHYVASAANILKTGLEVFSMFRWFGGGRVRGVASGIDRGLRGKERDKAYEQAVHRARLHFSKCSHCGHWVCKHCFNDAVALCEGCAPDPAEARARESARLEREREVEAARAAPGTPVPAVTCPQCGEPSGGGKFCERCGASCTPPSCQRCRAPLRAQARFCSECGTRV